MRKLLLVALGVLAFSWTAEAQEPTFVGSETCIGCHSAFNADIVNEYVKSGHPYKLNAVSGGPPTYPENTSLVEIPLPPGTEWDMFSYVIGGYGWKARFVKTDGRIFTVGDSAQYNLVDGSWVAYHKGEDKKYDYGCFQCHTTGPSAEGSWNGVDADSLGTFSEPGIRCEGCHGAGSGHAADPSNVKPPIQDQDLVINRCGECHQRGGATNAIPASGNYIRHHEQVNEMRASRHGDGMNTDLTCASCHNPHVALRYPDAAGEGFDGISMECESCHPNQAILINDQPKEIECVDCHMSNAAKSAVGMQLGNGFKGDVPTHLWGINTDAVPRDSMFTLDGKFVRLDEEGLGKATLDFACLGCHTDRDVAWASGYAEEIHTRGIVTSVESSLDVPAAFVLHQNYPNPFNPTTSIGFDLPETAVVTLTVYNVEGRLVAELLDNRMPAGYHKVTIDATDLSSGTYLYELKANDRRETRIMTLVK